MYRFTIAAILIYSILITVFGLFLVGFGYYFSDSFLKFVFAEFVDLKNWQLNWYIISFLIASSGIVGLVAGIAIWKGQEGGRRLWLGLISWQLIISSIQIGLYRIGKPDVISTIIVGCVVVLSWVVLCKKNIRQLFTYNKRYVFEFVLLATIALHIFCMSYIDDEKSINNILNTINEESFNSKIEKGMTKAVMNKMFGECYGDFIEYYDLYEAKNIDNVIIKGNDLINEYGRDRFILSTMSEAFYAKDNKQKAVELLESSIKGESVCELTNVNGKFLLHDKAQLHYKLHIIYSELGELRKAGHEYNIAVNLSKKAYGDNFNNIRLNQFKSMSISALNHFKKK